MRLRTIAVLLVLACVSNQVQRTECRRHKDKRSRGDEPQENFRVPSSDRNNNGAKSAGGKGMFQGKFTTKVKSQCTWAATGDYDAVLTVSCKKGQKSFECAYIARPTTCPQYTSNAKLYWKQVARSLKKQKKLCYDQTSLVKAGMCRKAPQDAHFKLSQLPKEVAKQIPPSSRDNELCPDQIDKRAFVEEYCSRSWSSLCAFLFSMVQNEDC